MQSLIFTVNRKRPVAPVDAPPAFAAPESRWSLRQRVDDDDMDANDDGEGATVQEGEEAEADADDAAATSNPVRPRRWRCVGTLATKQCNEFGSCVASRFAVNGSSQTPSASHRSEARAPPPSPSRHRRTRLQILRLRQRTARWPRRATRRTGRGVQTVMRAPQPRRAPRADLGTAPPPARARRLRRTEWRPQLRQR